MILIKVAEYKAIHASHNTGRELLYGCTTIFPVVKLCAFSILT